MQTPPPPAFQQPVMLPPPRAVRFEAISEGWRWYVADLGQWILSLILALVILMGPLFLVQMIVTATILASGPFPGPGSIPRVPSPTASLVMTFVSLPISVLGQLVFNGLLRRGLLQIRGGYPAVTEIFNLNGMGVQVLLYGAVAALLNLPVQVFSAFANPFFSNSSTNLVVYVTLVVVFACVQLLLLFTPLIIVDQKLPAFPAMALSLRTFGPHFLPLLGVLFLTGILMLSGLLGCLIGVLFTVPVYYLVVPVIYNDFFRPDAPTAVPYTGYYPRPTGPVEPPKFQP